VLGYRIRGFSLIELLAALVLLALISAVLYGSISLVADSWDRGEAKSQQTRQMRLTEEFLRTTLAAARPLRLYGANESPFPFAGADNWVAFPGLLPERLGLGGGGLYYFRLALTPDEKGFQLTLARVIPQYDAARPPEFREADVSVLADGIRTLKLQYFGSVYEQGPDESQPIWRDRWDDRLQWPVLIRVDVTPVQGPAWPPLIVELKLAEQTVCDEIRRAHNMCAN
jgi:general secretion pathway protein J